MSDTGDALRFPIEGDVDEAQVARQADIFADIFERAFAKAGPKIGRTLGKNIISGLRGLNVDPGKIFDQYEAAAEAASQRTRRTFVAGAEGITESFEAVAASARKNFGTTEAAAQRLEEEMTALRTRTEAMKRALTQIGAEPALLANVDAALQRIIGRQLEFNQRLEEISNDPNLLKGYRTEFETTRVLIGREVQELQSILRNLAQQQRIEGNRLNDVANRQAQERLQNARLANSRLLVNQQTTAAQQLAETRIAGQRELQDAQRRSRARIEIARFTFQQIKVLERGIAGVFRATGTVLQSTTNAIGSGLSRLTGAFRRADADMNDGLRGALLRREQSLSRSFSRQTEIVRRETTEASRAIQRLDAQASTGVIGALTGRSTAGALLGGGLAIGGGFALFQGLRNGIDVGGDFVQGLAVLQAQLKLTDEQMQDVRAQSIALGNDISLPGVSALDAAQAIQILAKQFAALGDTALPAAQAAARGVLQLSRAAGVGSEEAARVVGASVNVFGIAAQDAVLAADQVTNALTNAAGVGFGDFADSFTQAAGVVNLFSSDTADATTVMAEFNAAIAVLARNGLIGSDAGTSLKQFFLQANRGVEQAEEKLAEISAAAGVTGSVFFDAAGNARLLSDSLDILRRGTADLNQQQLASTLNKLFGSDAARAAAFLIGSTAEEFDRLTASILETGSAADIAAAQNTGLRGALDALGSVIETQQIKTYERYQGVLGRVVLGFSEMLNAFLEGRGAFGLLRDALIGLAAGLGSLLVAKAVGEAFQFMAIGLRAALTPLGALVVTVGLLGAAINVFARRSPELREALSDLGDTLQTTLGPLLERAIGGLTRLANAAERYLVPRLAALVTIIVNGLDRAIRATFTFITDTAIPALRAFGDFIANRVVPPLIEFGDTLIDGVTRGFNIARDAATRLLDTVQPLVQPAIDAFQRLGEAVAAAFGGDTIERGGQRGQRGFDFSGILPSLAGLAIGIVQSLGNLGEAMINAIRPQLQRFVDFVGGFVSGGDVADFLTGPFQRGVERLGFFIGNLATDPRLLAALEKLVGLAILTGVNFVKGLAKGIGDNLPALGSMFGGQLLDVLQIGLSKALDPQAIAKFIVSGVGAAAIGLALIRALRRPMNDAGKKVGQGFLGSLGQTLRRGFTGSLHNPFAVGFFSTTDRLVADKVRREGDAALAEQANFGRRLKLLNQTIATEIVDGIATVNTKKQFEDLQKQLGPDIIAGASFRASLGRLSADVATIFRGIGQTISTRTTEGFRTAGTGLASFRRNLVDFGRNTIADMKAAGIGVGQALGGGIVAGVSSALSGKALGSADSSFGAGLGLAGIIASSLFAGAAFGGGGPGLVVGGIVGAIGAVTAITTAHGEASKKAAAEVSEYADALRDVADAADLAPTAGRVVRENLQSESEEVRRFLRDVGFDTEEFANNVIDGSFDLADALEIMRTGMGRNFSAIIGELKRLESEGVDPVQALKDALRFGDQPAAQIRGLGALAVSIESLPVERVQTIIDVLDALTDERNELASGLDIAAVDRDLDQLAGSTARAAEVANEALKSQSTELRGLRTQQDRYVEGLIAMGAAQDALSAFNLDAIGQAIDSLNEQRLANINSLIADLTTQLDAAKLAAETAFQTILDIVAPVVDPVTNALNNAIQSIPSIADSLGAALSGAASGNIFSQAQLDDFANQFGGPLREAVAAAFTDNPALTSQQLRDQLAEPLQRALDQVQVQVGTDEAGNPILRGLNSAERAFFEEQMSGLFNDSLDTAIGDFQLKQSQIQSLQDQLTAAQLQLPVRVMFSATQIQQALSALGLSVPIGAIRGFLTDQQAAEAQGRARALADQTQQERREQPLPPPITFNQTVNQTINGGATPVATASESAIAMRSAAINGLLPRLTPTKIIRP